MIQPNCYTRCTCQGETFTCRPQKCLIDGSVCYVFGDPRYVTFDFHTLDFQGDCEYVLTQPCNNSDFIIAASNTAISSYVSSASSVRVIIPSRGLEIHLTRGGGGTITINDIPQPNNGDGIVHRSSGVKVLRTGGHPYVLLTIGFPLAISWDGSSRIEVSVSKNWQGQLCGLCGNYNNDASDDLMLPDGSLITSVNEFGTSWLHGNTTPTCGIPQPPPPCPASVLTAAQSRCNELMNSVFNVCNSAVDPTYFINSCISDYCLCGEEEREDCYCNSLSTYAAACAFNGVFINNWRNFLCRKLLILCLKFHQCYPYSCQLSIWHGISTMWSCVSSDM